MLKQRFPTDPLYVQSVQGLHRLHALAVSGEDESPQADALRAALEHPWHGLTEADRKRITGLSEDLYSISEPPSSPLPMNPQAQRTLVEAFEARQTGEWDKALDLLRRWGCYLEPALLAYLRGTVWMEGGDYGTASLFFQRAAQMESSNENYASLYLYALSRFAPAAALARAQEVLADHEVHPPRVVVRAAEIRFASTQGMADVDAFLILQGLVGVLERALAKLQTEESRQSSSYSMAVVLMGFCHDRLGALQTALSYYNQGVQANPTNDGLLVARGILRYGVDPAAVRDFEQAIRYASPVVWPYFFLAHHFLVSNRFEECRRMCEHALTLPASSSVKANLYEWLAISCSELGFPPAQVRTTFEEAVRSEPANDRIRRNFRAFEESLAGQSRQSRVWEPPTASAVQAYGRAEYQPMLAA